MSRETSSGSCRTRSAARKTCSGVRMGIEYWRAWPGRLTAPPLPYIDRYGPLREAGPAAEPLSDLAGRRRVRSGDGGRPADRRYVPGPRHRASAALAGPGERVLRLPGLFRLRALED